MMGTSDNQGYKDEKPRHKVTLEHNFMSSAQLVTQDLYEALLGKNPSQFQHDHSGMHPVERVSWIDALSFCNQLSELFDLTPVYSIEEQSSQSELDQNPKMSTSEIDLSGGNDESDTLKVGSLHADDVLSQAKEITRQTKAKGLIRTPKTLWTVTWNHQANGYRLPTEAEWELMAGAQEPWNYAGGHDLSAIAWHGENAQGSTQPVSQKRANAWGLHDCSGNVWEWVYDAWNAQAYQSRIDGVVNPIQEGDIEEQGKMNERVARGGSWFGESDNCRITYRARFEINDQLGILGFRLVRSVIESDPQSSIEQSDAAEDQTTSVEDSESSQIESSNHSTIPVPEPLKEEDESSMVEE
jgi:hypothetical protein